MKNTLRKTLSLFLAFTLLCSLGLTAAASEAMGEDLTSKGTLLNQKTQLSTNVFWSTAYSDLRTENVVTYEPNADVTPIVTFGDSLTTRTTVTSAARALESQGYRVAAGINGDFFNTSNGLPIGILVSEGEVLSSDGGYYAMGFREDGSAVIGKPGLSISANLGYQGSDSSGYFTDIIRTVAGINKARVSTGGIYLYTYDFNNRHTTGNTEAGVDVLCTIVDGSLSIGGTMTLVVDQVIEATSATAIGPDQIVLSANALSNTYYTDALRNIPVGATVTVTVSAANEAWNDVQYAVGALYSLVQDGAVVSGLPSGVNPRTAVGVTADGTVVFYTIDGRRSGHSIGASLSQVAQRMIELGCVAAIGLDGGGSTTITVTQPDDTTAATINRPSDGSERAVANHLFLVATNEPTGELGHFYVQADNAYVLAGSKVEISAAAVDTNYIPMDEDYDYDLEASDGELDGNILTTPKRGGEITVTASSGRREGSTTVYAIEDPTDVVIRDSSGTALTTLNAATGTTTQLAATAAYNHISLKADPEAFTWEVTGDIGTVDEHGLFTAAAPGTGTITVSASLDNSLWQVTASVADAVDGILPAGSVTVTYNGAPYGSYDPATGLVTVALPGPGESHEAMRITITARDLSGNIGRASVDVEPYGVDHKFTDINDYWAATYVDFLYNANITTGYADGTFRPNDNISRQQFAVMLYRYLGLDGTQYESVTLPFADNASIGDYALTAVKALYTEGIINGSTGSDGRLYFNPGGSLTRAQAAAMIGRTQEKGYAIVDLTFSDTASIPAYATYYIQTMAAQGVISGYADGTFQPGANITRGQMAKILYNLM